MKKVLYFFLAVAVLLILGYSTTTEGFVSFMGVDFGEMNKGTPSQLNTKATVVNQPTTVTLAELGVGNIQPSPPPASDLPTAKYEQRSKELPSPYKNPTMEPAKYIRILGLKEDLQAFFGFQAGPLQDRNDPAIQIPLTRARADMQELIDVQSVMERNPGLPSRLTNKSLDDIRSNLRYLQATLRDLEASGAIEGFANPSSTTASINTDKRATLKELQEFQIKVVVEIARLQASGTSDPVIVARVNTLNRIKDEVDEVITKLQSGVLIPETVPIFASDIEKALPVLGNPTSPLGQIVQKTGLPPAISSLFPGGLSPKDTEQMEQINNIVKGYMTNLFEGTSWGLNLNIKYDNPNVLKLKKEAGEATKAEQTNPVSGLPGVIPLNTKAIDGASVEDPVETPAISSSIKTYEGYDTGLPGTSIRPVFPEPKTGHLDWKRRSHQITEQIRRRGMNPLDFGALPEGTEVSDNFSWKGYTQMMCSRLNSTMDPGLPVTVGCPPKEWSGWKN